LRAAHALQPSRRMTNIDITQLETVHGGNRGRAAWNGVRRAYNAARPIVREAAELAQDVGILGGVGYGAKKLWDEFRGNGQQQPQQTPQR
jgi:hypothetical protein